MEKSTVYFTDFRCPVGTSQLDKLKKLCIAAGVKDIDMEGKFVAIKMHFGELGNMAFLRPNYAKVVADLCKEQGGLPFLTDCNTLYPGSRKNALEHLDCANLNGFNTITTGCQIIIGDGLRGTDEIEVPVVNGEYCKTALIGHAIMDADIFISLSHFKGHEATGFGGALKKISVWDAEAAPERCSSMPVENRRSIRMSVVAATAVQKNAEAMQFPMWIKKQSLTMTNAKDAAAASVPAVLMRFIIQTAVQTSFSTGKWLSMHRLSVMDVRVSISLWYRISARTVTAMGRTMLRSCRISECLQASTRLPLTRRVPMPA